MGVESGPEWADRSAQPSQYIRPRCGQARGGNRSAWLGRGEGLK